MANAINIRSDNDSSKSIEDLWKKVSQFEEEPSMINLNYPPHFTFAIYEEITQQQLFNALDNVFMKEKKVDIVFDQLSCFDTNPLVLYAQPKNTEELIKLHSRIHECIDPNLSEEYYRPDKWVPHCTLAYNVQEDKRNEALQFAKETIEEFTVTFDVADVTSFHPVKVLKESPLL